MQMPDGTSTIFTSIPAYKVLQLIHEGTLKHLPTQSTSFITNPRCKWAYVIDFAAKTMETFASGFVLDKVSFEKLSMKYVDDLMTMFEEKMVAEGLLG